MIEVFEVETAGADGSTVVARTTLALDGDMVVTIAPSILDDAAALHAHLAQVHQRLQQQLKRLKRAGSAVTVARWGSIAAAIGSAAASAQQALAGQLESALWWLAGVLAGALARWLLPKLVVRTARWLIHRSRG